MQSLDTPNLIEVKEVAVALPEISGVTLHNPVLDAHSFVL